MIDLKQRLGLKKLLLLVPDQTRFTRAGAGHGGHLLSTLGAKGILVYFVAEDLLVENDLTLQMALMLLSTAHQTAKSIARSSTIGTDARFAAGKTPYCRRPPLGLDRVYLVDGKPIHIIRNLADGTQEMLDPKTLKVTRRFGKNPKKGIPAHYIKQKNETVDLCAGAPEAMAKLFLLFEMHYVRRMKYRPIVLELNEAGISSPQGVEWSAGTVQSILLHPIYHGLLIRYRTTRGIYVQGGSPNGEPEPSEVTPEELDQNAKIRVRRRTRDKWKEKAQPKFEYFIPEHIREEAGLTQRQIGATLGEPQAWVHNCETGNRRVDVTEFCDWCRACSIPPTNGIRRLDRGADSDSISGNAHPPDAVEGVGTQ